GNRPAQMMPAGKRTQPQWDVSLVDQPMPARRGRKKGVLVAALLGLFLLAAVGVGAVLYPQFTSASRSTSNEDPAARVHGLLPSTERRNRPPTEPAPTAKLGPSADQKPDPKPITRTDPKPAPKEGPKKPSVPDGAQVAAAEKTIHETYKVQFGRKKA